MENNLEELIRLAKMVATPWKWTVYVLTTILVISICANVYLLTRKVEINLVQDYDSSDSNTVSINDK